MTRRTSNAPLLLLVASLALIGVAAGVAVVTAWKSRANTRQLLGDYAAFAGWSYEQHLVEESGTRALGHGRTDRPQGTAPGSPCAPRGQTADVPGEQAPGVPVRPRPGARDLFPLPAWKRLARPGWGLAAAVARGSTGGCRLRGRRVPVPWRGREGAMVSLPGSHRLVGYGPMATEWGDTLIYGFTIDSAEVSADVRASPARRLARLRGAGAVPDEVHQVIGDGLEPRAAALLDLLVQLLGRRAADQVGSTPTVLPPADCSAVHSCHVGTSWSAGLEQKPVVVELPGGLVEVPAVGGQGGLVEGDDGRPGRAGKARNKLAPGIAGGDVLRRMAVFRGDDCNPGWLAGLCTRAAALLPHCNVLYTSILRCFMRVRKTDKRSLVLTVSISSCTTWSGAGRIGGCGCREGDRHDRSC